MFKLSKRLDMLGDPQPVGFWDGFWCDVCSIFLLSLFELQATQAACRVRGRASLAVLVPRAVLALEVRSNPTGLTGFLGLRQRLNVLLTRARDRARIEPGGA